MADETTTKKIDFKKIWTFVRSRVFTILVIIGLIIFATQQCSTIRELKRQKYISDNIIFLST
jgi:hypothetical protein